ncbi:MAG: Ldh family oxidoreductase [Bacteroidia bacterium]|nr:Ldh family oxidoreductase [Bacteroidia bacterium]
MTESQTLSQNDLRQFTENILKAIGCSHEDALLAADVLICADLRGIDSHGVARLSGYVRLWKAGRINTKPNVRLVRDKYSTGTVDGDAGLGLVIAPKAMEIAIDKAKSHGSGWIAVQNSNHFGIGAYHAMMALQHDMIGMSMTNASPLVAPLNSKERMLGTNPICYAVPALNEEAFILDMATSAAANGKLEIAERNGQSVPLGWLQNNEGNDTSNPKDLKGGGYLLPLGSDKDHGAHKGYGLGAIVDILSGVLGGANYGPWVPPFVSFLPVKSDLPGKGLGHFLGAMQIDGFEDPEVFKKRMDHWINRFKNAEPAEGKKVIIHGEPEAALYKTRLTDGIPLVIPVVKDLIALAEELKADHPF